MLIIYAKLPIGDHLYPKIISIMPKKPPRMNAEQTLENLTEMELLAQSNDKPCKYKNRIEHCGFKCHIIETLFNEIIQSKL